MSPHRGGFGSLGFPHIFLDQEGCAGRCPRALTRGGCERRWEGQQRSGSKRGHSCEPPRAPALPPRHLPGNGFQVSRRESAQGGSKGAVQRESGGSWAGPGVRQGWGCGGTGNEGAVTRVRPPSLGQPEAGVETSLLPWKSLGGEKFKHLEEFLFPSVSLQKQCPIPCPPDFDDRL